MNNLKIRIALFVILLSIVSLGFAFSMVLEQYLLTVLCFLCLVIVCFSFYKFSIKTLVQFKRITDSIQCGEHNISLTTQLTDPTYLEYHHAMSSALEKISTLMQKNEADNSFYNLLLNRIDFGLLVLNQEGEVIWINKKALDIVGRPKASNIHEIKDKSEILGNALQDLPLQSSTMIRLALKDRERNISIHRTTIELKGKPLDVFSIKDVQSIVDKTEDIAWQQLVQVLTHEMMNSLSPIISLSESLSQNNEDPIMLAKGLEVIHRRSKGLVTFIQNYKKIAQIPTPQCTLIHLQDLLCDVLQLLQLEDQINITTQITPQDLNIFADRTLIEQVFINLLKNAIEACKNKPHPSIQINAYQTDNGQTEISFTDNGMGMEPDVTSKIFTPFYTTKPFGSGIGLSICRQIISKHGGTLTVASTVHVGSTFTIRI